MNPSKDLQDIGLEDGGEFLLPAQCNDLVRRPGHSLSSEHRLLWAVLEEAIRTYLANMRCLTTRQQRAFVEVQQWILPVPERSQGFFAYQNICDLLGIDADRLRRGLTNIRAAGPIRRHAGRLRRLAA